MTRIAEFATLEEFQRWFKDRLKWAKTLEPDDMPSFTVRNFTPEMAYWVWETYNTRNRDRRPKWIKELIEIIQTGKWKNHTQGISISTLDRLNNGQHRLEAIFEAGLPVVIQFAFNEPDEAFDALDSGQQRKVSDIGKQRGIENAKGKAPGVKILMALEQGKRSTSGTVTPSKITDWIETHTVVNEIYGAAHRIASKTQPSSSRKSGVVAGLYLIREANPGAPQFTEFTEKLENGAGMHESHPVLSLRNGLIGRVYDNPRRADGAQGILTAAAIINGWNLWVAGRNNKRPGSLEWDPLGATPFPAPIGVLKQEG